jgi:phenylpropionate dioxygenase-like ring-hydroxylating dioxygenase large terminal subunit
MDTLTRVGAGTPMGKLMREYWLPAARSTELIAGGAPVRLMLLGEKLIAFRGHDGEVGVLDHRCPHRCASLFFGRNEEGGLRCSYHGWKFDTKGQCLDMPNVPKHQAFTDKVSAKVYPCVERNGLLWVYMGERETVPDLPPFEAGMLDFQDMNVMVTQRECNWLQGLEGDIDTSHFGFLHAGAVDASLVEPSHPSRYALEDRAPEYMVADTDWGVMYAAFRNTEQENETYWRFAHYLFPFWTMTPEGVFEDHIVARAWVPMDDTHTMFFHLSWKKNTPPGTKLADGTPMPGTQGGGEYLPNTTDWFGRWRLAANASNDYLMDRDSQDVNYSGIKGIFTQDQAMTESMGPIVDHDHEHLAVSDRMITRVRRRMELAVRAHEEGITPPGVDNPETYCGARSGGFTVSKSVGWLQAYGDQIHKSLNPTGVLRYAAE